MRPLRTFFMEDYLESFRFTARYNLGESGARPTTVAELLLGSGLTPEHASAQFLGTLLRDSPNWGREDLRERVASFHPGASRENVLITTGTSEALLLLFRQLQPKRTALAIPAFQLLYEIPLSLGSELVPLPVRWDAEGRPFIEPAEWLRRLERGRPDCIILNNPHNPSGLVLEPKLLEAVLDFARSSGAHVIGDEHYRFLSSEQSVLGPTVYRPGERSFVTGSFIKCLGCPGLRVGWCVGDTATLAAMQNEKNFTTHTVNPLSEWIAHEVLKDLGSEVISAQRALWARNRAELRRFLAGSTVFYGSAPEGGLVTCVGVREAGGGESFARTLEALRAASVFVLPLEAMEVGAMSEGGSHPLERGQGFRLGLGAEADTFAEALRTMEQAGAQARRGGA